MKSAQKRKYYPLVSIVTVNYGQAEITCQLIESLNKITYPNIEIIVVDNACKGHDPMIIKQRFPAVVLIENPINYGFAAGNNYGIMSARGKYVLLLNNDTEVDPAFLEPMVNLLESRNDIGAVSPKIRFYHKPDTIQYAGYTPMNLYTIRNFAIGSHEIDKGQYDKTGETALGHGAALMVPMEVIRKVGLMSYIFFLYYEEADWCCRIKKAGYKIFFAHNSLVLHKESVTTGRTSPLKIYYLTRNRIVFMRRNIFGITFLISILYQLFIAIPKNAFTYLIKGQFRLSMAYYKAIGWHISNIFNPEIHENPML